MGETEVKTANREYKNSVFTLLFGDIAHKLYCAVTGKEYDPSAKVVNTTLTDVLFRGRLNDLSFELDGKLIVLIEHQSTLNENMPFRMLQYISLLYKRYFVDNKNAIYGESMIKVPRPEFIMLYNGIRELPGGVDRMTLCLSDMFIDAGEAIENPMGGLELTVEVFNINSGRNPEMAARCVELRDYEIFIQMVRENEKSGLIRAESVKKAVFDCINRGVLKPFLETFKWEVIEMLTVEWDFEVEKEVVAEERAEKRAGETKMKIARNLKELGVDVNAIAKSTGFTVEEVLRLF